MRLIKYIAILLPLLFTLLSFSQKKQTSSPSVIIQGAVVSDQDGQPISGAHVFVIHGEEEALTNSKGEFRVESWQKLPLRLTIEYKSYRTISISVSDASRKQVVKLKVL